MFLTFCECFIKHWPLDGHKSGIHDQLEEILGKQKRTDNAIVMEDFNAVVGEGKEDRVVGEFGLGKKKRQR